jgi:hypothetical protein
MVTNNSPPAKSIDRLGGRRKKLAGSLDVALMPSLMRKEAVDDRVARERPESHFWLSRSTIFENLPRRVVSAGAHHAAAGMCRGPAKIESFDRSSIIRIARQWPHKPETRK